MRLRYSTWNALSQSVLTQPSDRPFLLLYSSYRLAISWAFHVSCVVSGLWGGRGFDKILTNIRSVAWPYTCKCIRTYTFTLTYVHAACWMHSPPQWGLGLAQGTHFLRGNWPNPLTAHFCFCIPLTREQFQGPSAFRVLVLVFGGGCGFDRVHVNWILKHEYASHKNNL